MIGGWLRIVLAVAFATVATAAAAQQSGKVPAVGVLMLAAGPHDTVVEAFRLGLRELGYVEGRDIRIEHRSAAGDLAFLQPTPRCDSHGCDEKLPPIQKR